MPNDRPRERVTVSYQRGSLRICLVLLLLSINDVINLETASHSGLDVENGLDQTTDHALTTDKKLALELEILKFLGLPGKSNNSIDKALMMEQSGYKFMLNVYEITSRKPNERVVPSEFDMTENDLRIIEQSDVITTFMAQQSHQEVEDKSDRVKITWFDVTGIRAENQLISAELKLYGGPDPKNRKNSDAFTVTAYQVQRTKDGQIEKQLVDSANTTAGHEGWLTLNVTTSLLHWMKHPVDNNGLYLSVHPIDSSSHETTLDDIGIVSVEGDAERQPFMAGFFRTAASQHKAVL